MKISVITVTYNCVQTVERTLTSVLGQRAVEVEYIVVDGNSTDGTKEVIEKYRNRLVKWISEEDTGIYNAMNKGISCSSGDVICFLNGDDYFISENVLEKIANTFHKYCADIVCGRIITKNGISPYVAAEDYQKIYTRMIFPHPAMFVRRKLFTEIGCFNEKYKSASDYEWILRAYTNGKSIYCIEDVITYFSLDGVSAGVEGSLETYEISREYIKRSNLPEFLPLAREEYRASVVRWLFKKCAELLGDEAKVFLGKALEENNECILWGAGNDGYYLYTLFQEQGITVLGFIDRNPQKYNYCYDGIEVTSFDEKAIGKKIVVSTRKYEQEIENELKSRGLIHKRDFILHSDIDKELIRVGIEKYDLDKTLKEKGIDIRELGIV